MNCGLGSNRVLARGLLRLFKLATVDGHRGVAECLLCALEQLARSDPACESILDLAYLWSMGGNAGATLSRPPGHAPQ
ncbi:MAG: hypothetical protein ACOY7P_14085 [Pseudomonadota bacterium]